MEAHADAVIDAFHMSFACASQILENLTLIDGDDLFRLAHGRFIQSSLLLNDIMRRLTKLLQLRRKRHHDQGRAKETAQTGFQTAQKRQKEAEEEREKILQDALDLVTDQSRYENEIIDKPASREECKELLNSDQDAIAFRYVRTSGQYDGQHCIVFTDDSLLRLLKRVGMTKELYGPFKERALKAGVMVMKSASARFGSLSLNGFWFYDQKF